MYFLGYSASNLIYGCHCFGITCVLQAKDIYSYSYPDDRDRILQELVNTHQTTLHHNPE